MNVRSLAGRAVNGVAAEQSALLRRCAGYTVDEAGGQIPVYEDMPVLVRVQPLSDIPPRPQAGAWQARVARRFSLNARCGALNRPAGSGGDLLVWNDRVWLVDQVLEDWTPEGGWALVRGVLQMDLAEAPQPGDGGEMPAQKGVNRPEGLPTGIENKATRRGRGQALPAAHGSAQGVSLTGGAASGSEHGATRRGRGQALPAAHGSAQGAIE